jgi:nitrogen regulatory protein P-II 1
MKQINAFVHHIRTAPIIEALSDAGYRNITLLDVKGSLKPLSDTEKDYSTQAGLVISEARISLVCNDDQVDDAASIIRRTGSIGAEISGWVYVSHIEQALPIDGSTT